MALNITTIINLCASILNASPDTYGTIIDPLHPTAEITDAIKAADRQVAQAIIDTQGHRSRVAFATLITASIPSGQTGKVDDLVEAVQVDNKAGKFVPGDVFYNLSVDSLVLTTKTGYYTLEGQLLGAIYNSSLKYLTYKYTEPGGSTLAAPDEYFMAVVCGALALLFPKEGAFTEAANHFGGLFIQMLEMIKKGITVLPAIAPFVRGR